MKLPTLGSLNGGLPPIAEDVSARIRDLFDECPQLSGFTVQDVRTLPDEVRPQGVEQGLAVTHLAIYPLVSRDQCQAIYELLSLALLEIVCERPGAKDFLPGRTFARAMH